MATQGISQPAARNEPHTTDVSDWEYEYDEHETEDIYFTLDLTTHVPSAIQEKQYAKNGKLIRPEKNDAENAPQDDDANGEAALNGDDDPQNDDNAVDDDAAPLEAGRLQVLDLHTEKPYIKYNNGFYSCHWFTDLGTQFWITNPGVVGDPKLSGHVLDVVGSSQARLVAKPANLKRKRDAPELEHHQGETAAQSIEIDEDAASDVSDADSRAQFADRLEQNPNEPMVVVPPKNDLHLQGQASFMERLSAIKIKKGEPDAHDIPRRIPVYYKGAYNADELRAAHGVPIAELQPAPTPTLDRVSPTPDKDADEGAPTPVVTAADENSPAPLPPPPSIRGKRTRGGSRAPRGGAISNAARRSNLGLGTTTTTTINTNDPSQPKRKRGRPSNAERALRAEAEAAASASNSFALDPQLGGPTQPGAEDLADAKTPARSLSREASVAASSVQGGERDRPRKRRRTAAQMEEARRLDEERQAKLAAAKAAKVAKARREEDVSAGAPEEALPAGQRSARRTTRSSLNANEDVRKVDDDAGESGEVGETETPVVDTQVEGDAK
jgi:hypothetical protein